MFSKILKTVKKYNMLQKGESVLIALSGGADSVLLAYFLLSVKEQYDLTLKAAHIEHGIRGAQSIADAEFCRRFCKEKNIEFHLLSIDAPALARQNGCGVEEISRIKRYDFFNSLGCDKIATAHSLTDSIETVLFRLARGTSLKGLCGIPPVRDNIIRPLIELKSEEIRDFLDSDNIEYRTDSTNEDIKYSRNFVRHRVIPLMKQLNPSFETAAAHMLDSLNNDNSFLESVSLRALEDASDGGCLSLEKLRALSASVLNRVLAEWLENNGFKVNATLLSACRGLVFQNGRYQISGCTYAVSAAGSLRIADFSDCESCGFVADIHKYPVKEFLNICEFNNKKFDFYCDCDKIVGKVAVRSRKEGDSIALESRGCTKSLKKLFNELHIPPEKRGRVAVVADELGVIGVCGVGSAQRVGIDGGTKSILAINIVSEDKD